MHDDTASTKVAPPEHLTPEKVVLVTGGAKRIGASIVRGLHAAGMRIALHYNTSGEAAEQLGERLNAERPQSAQLFQANLLDPGQPAELVARAVARLGRLDAVVNNASSFHPTPIAEVTLNDWNALIGTNLLAPLLIAQAAAPALGASKGVIVNIADVYGERPRKGYAVYCTAKAGLIMLTKALAVELGPQVRVNAVAPGAILWPEDDSDPDMQQIARTALRRRGDPEDIANAVRFLICDAPYVTGETLRIDGGRLLYV